MGDQGMLDFKFVHLKGYAQFLKDNLLDQVTAESLRLHKDVDLPLLKLFKHLSDEQLFALIKQSNERFLNQILDDSLLAYSLENLQKWKKNEVEGVPKDKVETADLIFAYSNSKRLLINLFPNYSSDAGLLINIFTELENFYTHLKIIAFETLFQIQQEKIIREKEFSKSLINNSVDGILAFDNELRFTEWNSVLESWNQIKRENIIGKKIFETFPNFEKTPQGEAMYRVLKGEKVYLPPHPFGRKTGFYEINIVPLKENGQVIGGISIVHDVSEKIEAEKKLEEQHKKLEQSEHFNRQISTLVPSLVAVYNVTTGEYLFVNSAFEKVLGYPPEKIYKEGINFIISITHPDDLQDIMEKNERALEKANVNPEATIIESFDYRMKDSAGNWKWFSTFGTIFSRTPDGKVENIINVSIDVTQRRENERKLKEAHEELESTNEELREKQEEYQAANEELRESQEELFATNQELREQIELRQQVEETLKRSRDYYLQIMEDFPALIARTNSEGQFDYFNKTWLDFTGSTFKKESGKGWMENLHKDDKNKFLELFEKSFKNKKGFSMEFRLKHSDGSHHYLFNMSKPLYDIDGKFIGLLSSCYDINDLKEAEAEVQKAYYELKESNEELVRTEELLKELNQELEEKVILRTEEIRSKNDELLKINADLDNFVYTASHDLKAPIANLEALIGILKKKVRNRVEEEDIKIFDMISISVSKFNKTIRDLTAVTEVQKKSSDNIRPLSFKEIFEDVKLDITQLILEAKPVFKIDFKVNKMVFVEKNMRSIFYNLLTNALKYRSPDRELVVNIKTEEKDSYILLTVSDNGLGIKPDQQDKLFSMFKRFHTHVEGTGIGLYIVKRIVENNEGKIEVESKVNEGTTFKLYLKK